MIVPCYKTPPHPWLFPEAANLRFKTRAEIRNHVGAYFETLTVELTGAKQLRTDSRQKNCPDLLWRPRTFIECKSTGKSAHVLVYTHRLEKDLKLIDGGDALFYFVWVHRGHCYSHDYLFDLHADLLATVKMALVVPFAVIVEVCRGMEPRLLNTAYTKDNKHKLGYGKNEYGRGWSVPVRALRDRVYETNTSVVRGREISVCSVR